MSEPLSGVETTSSHSWYLARVLNHCSSPYDLQPLDGRRHSKRRQPRTSVTTTVTVLYGRIIRLFVEHWWEERANIGFEMTPAGLVRAKR